MKPNLTKEQLDVIASSGKVLVSASAGSGKTFVMIKKIVGLIANGVDVEDILAITFTNKAAASMKDKLKEGLIKYYAENKKTLDEASLKHLKTQIGKVQIADVSTVHAFCTKLIRMYFYLLDVDGTFDVFEAGSPLAYALKNRAVSEVFDDYYKRGDGDFLALLNFLKSKYTDQKLKEMVIEAQEKLRVFAGYKNALKSALEIYTESGFDKVCARYKGALADRCEYYCKILEDLKVEFAQIGDIDGPYATAIQNLLADLECVKTGDLFAPIPSFDGTGKPRKKKNDSEILTALGDKYKAIADEIKKGVKSFKSDLSTREQEYKNFLDSGLVARAFSALVLDYDEKFSALKQEEGKLEFSDLEHLAIQLLEMEDVRVRLREKYKHVYVDEYQDTNPTQEYMLSLVAGENVFTVGDEKQAIYGFRGSNSAFFSQKRERYDKGEGNNYKLTTNFRSADNILHFVNSLFGDIMTRGICGFDYLADKHSMSGGSKYDVPDGTRYKGEVVVHKIVQEEVEDRVSEVYSVKKNTANKNSHTLASKAILSIVMDELRKDVYDIEQKTFRRAQAGDICILTRKRNNAHVQDIVRTIRDAGYSVDGYGADNLLERSEVKKILDILNYLDNQEQDVALVSAMLSPLGNFNENELAKIKLFQKNYDTFKWCCDNYALNNDDVISQKIKAFYENCNYLRARSKIMGAGKLIEEILIKTGLDSVYAQNGGTKLKNVRFLKDKANAPGGELYLNEFLSKIKECNGKIECPEVAVGDNIKIMTMHASKGLEFPIVILADISASFKGNQRGEYNCNEEFGFIFEKYDSVDKSKKKTLLNRLYEKELAQEELKNEANLFYVACTRAMCKLHIVMGNEPKYNPAKVPTVYNYADMADFSKFYTKDADFAQIDNGVEKQKVAVNKDDELSVEIEKYFMADYPYENSVNLPVKTSASAILHGLKEEAYISHKMFLEEEEGLDNGGETGTQIGLAYHAFLENCDFSKRDERGVKEQLSQFKDSKILRGEYLSLLDEKKLVQILSMPIFDGLERAQTYREREFLCHLPANEIMDCEAQDEVLIQGAIDLMAIDEDGIKVIDYKYSKKSNEALVHTYARQLLIYKKVVARILKVDEQKIKTVIINLYHGKQIDL